MWAKYPTNLTFSSLPRLGLARLVKNSDNVSG